MGCRKGNLKCAIRTRKAKQRRAQRIAKMLEEENQEKEAQITAKQEEDPINQRKTERERKTAIKAQRRHEKQQLLIAEEAELLEMYADELDANENNNNYPKQTKQKKRNIVDRWKDQCQISAQSKIKEAERRRLELSISVYNYRYGPGRKSCRYCLGWGHDFENCQIRKHDWIVGEEQIFPGRNSFGRPKICQPQPNTGPI